MVDLLSNKPEDLRAMADEQIAYFKEELAKFDAKQAPHYHRLVEYVRDAEARDDRERYEDYSRQASRYRADWEDARRPYLQQIQRIAMLRDDVDPPKITFTWAQGVFADVKPIPEP